MTCLLHATVPQIISTPNGREVERLDVVSVTSDRKATVRARSYVVATGRIENSRLLLVSGPEQDARPDRWPGLGNERDVVGRYFMEHPNYTHAEVELGGNSFLQRPSRSGRRIRARLDVQLNAEQQKQEGVLNHSVFLIEEPETRGGFELFWNRTFGGETSLYALRVRLEHAPVPENRITLTDERDSLGIPRLKLHMTIGELERRTIQVATERFARAIGMADLGRLQMNGDPMTDDLTDGTRWQHHHYGGTRMHDDPAKGVVDANCKVHSMSNLYVAGSSVFPTGGHTNPTLNLVAMAIRLSDHLKEKHGP